MDKIALLLPTKGRVELCKRFIQSWEENNADYSKIFPIIDDSEAEEYNLPAMQVANGNGLVDKLNMASELLLDVSDFKYFGFVADDLVIKTPDFDKKIVEYFESHPEIKIIHVEDELHHEAIANHWFIRAEIVKKWGFFVPPTFRHLFIDNFITAIGKETNSIAYLNDVVIEHRHFVNQKAEKDDTYKISATEEMFKHDEKAFNRLINSKKYIKLKQTLCK